MIDLRNRSDQKEILDQDDIPFLDIKQNLQELNTINTLLGGHSITLDGIKNILKNSATASPIIICEIGCGGGDNLMMVAQWCKKNKIVASFIGIDIKDACISYCKERFPDNAEWIRSDYATTHFAQTPNIIFSSLFCHHFSNQQITGMLQWMQLNATTGFFINDLHRNTIAYYSIKCLTVLFSKSYLVKHDAPLSVARGFSKSDWKNILDAANMQAVIKWKWAFRFLIICKTENAN